MLIGKIYGHEVGVTTKACIGVSIELRSLQESRKMFQCLPITDAT